MKKFIQIAFLLSLSILLSCNKEVSIDLPSYSSKIVVDGWIEQDGFANVLLTLSAPYFGEIDSVSLRKLVLTRAKVTVSNGETSEVLTLHPNQDYFPPYVYSGNSISGEIGKTYELKVEYAGRVITGVTTIPAPPKVKKVWFEASTNNPAQGMLWCQISDNISQRNYYRIFTKVLNKNSRYYPIQFPNISDRGFEGKTRDIPLYPGTTNTLSSHTEEYYHTGDTILVKVCTMDATSYEYWEDFQQEMLNSKNPFATSNSTLQSNISDNALGIWCGYGVQNSQVIAIE